MLDLYVLETLEEMDKNGDGFVTVEEYVGECTPHSLLSSWLLTLHF